MCEMGITMGMGGAPWLRCRASESRVGILCCGVKNVDKCFTLHCSSSLSCINEYLAIDIIGYVYEQLSRINCSTGWMIPREAEMVTE